MPAHPPPVRLALIPGSTREGRRGDAIVRWVCGQIAGEGPFLLDLLDIDELDLPARHPGGPHASVSALRARIADADAFLVVTPEYNRGYPAPLKQLIDLVGKEWRGKPVGFVSYGGISGGLRAVEQLRLVFAELHAATIRDGVAFANVWDQFDEAGVLRDADAAERAMATMLAQLHWWANTLRAGREAVPYGRFAA